LCNSLWQQCVMNGSLSTADAVISIRRFLHESSSHLSEPSLLLEHLHPSEANHIHWWIWLGVLLKRLYCGIPSFTFNSTIISWHTTIHLERHMTGVLTHQNLSSTDGKYQGKFFYFILVVIIYHGYILYQNDVCLAVWRPAAAHIH
jgi:hypothetical protein